MIARRAYGTGHSTRSMAPGTGAGGRATVGAGGLAAAQRTARLLGVEIVAAIERAEALCDWVWRSVVSGG